MQINSLTGEVYASSAATAPGVTIDLWTAGVQPLNYVVICWHDGDHSDPMRWSKEFGTDLAAAIDEYNRWARNKETAPCSN